MIVCPNCGKENQDHYKFCLGCGSDLPRSSAEEQQSTTPTPPAGIPAVAAEPEPAPSPAPEPAPEPVPEEVVEPVAETAPPPEVPEIPPTQEQPAVTQTPPQPEPEAQPETTADGGVVCTGCGAQVPPGFAFCGACGTSIPGAEPAAAPAPTQFAKDSARLVLILPDGSEGGQVEIPTTEVAVGRDAGSFFANDPFLSPTHAIFRTDGNEVVVRDGDSLNGVFMKINPMTPVEIQSGNIFRMGQELILFEKLDRGSVAPDGTERMGSPIEGLWGRVALIVGRGRLGNAFPVGGDGVVFGRERGNILFPEDGYVSGVHLKLYTENNNVFISDLGSSNGTFVRINEETRVQSGSFLLMGQQLFRVDL